MRTVFNNSMCAHVWAQLKQPHGRSGSMRFDGAVAYSYAQPVAHIITPKGRAPVALFSALGWSMTTTRHINEYRAAASHYPSFRVLEIFPYDARTIRDEAPNPRLHAKNIGYLVREYNAERDKLMRAPADSWRLSDISEEERGGIGANKPTRAHETLYNYAETLCKYCKAFGLTYAAPLPWASDAAAAIARRDRILNDPKRAAKQAKAAEARARAEVKRRERAAEQAKLDAAEAAVRVAEWIKGNPAVRLHYTDVSRAQGALLRIVGDKVETSLGAEVPLADTRRVFEVLYSRVKRGETWQRDTRYEDGDSRQESYSKLGIFRLDSIDADGNVKAGCHWITRAELERFGALLAALPINPEA